MRAFFICSLELTIFEKQIVFLYAAVVAGRERTKGRGILSAPRPELYPSPRIFLFAHPLENWTMLPSPVLLRKAFYKFIWMIPLRTYLRGPADSTGCAGRTALSASCGAPRMYGYGARREADYVVNLRVMHRILDDSGRRRDTVSGVAEMQPLSTVKRETRRVQPDRRCVALLPPFYPLETEDMPFPEKHKEPPRPTGFCVRCRGREMVKARSLQRPSEKRVCGKCVRRP